MELESVLAFVGQTEPPALEIRVNFGVFAGREATAAEIDDLAKTLLPKVGGEVSIVREERHELSTHTEVSLQQVRIEVDAAHTPVHPEDRAELAGRLLELAEQWVQGCIANRHVEVGGS
jgi:hypothetical protein